MNLITTENESLLRMPHEEVQPERRSKKDQFTPGRRARRQQALLVTGRIVSIFPTLVLGILLLSAWYTVTATQVVSPLLLPAPKDVFTSLLNGIGSGVFLRNVLVTVQESIAGFLLAVAVALPLGYGLAKSRLLAFAIKPYLIAGQAIPAIVIAPLLILWLGYGWLPYTVICMLVVLFPMIINTILGIETIDRALTDAARVEGASGLSLLLHIEFPLALPSLLAAMRTGLTLSIVGALVGEFVGGGDQGLGGLVLLAKNQYDLPFMFATLVVLGALAALYYGVTWIVTKVVEKVY